MSVSSDIRSKFLAYFRRHGHTVVPSSPLVPRLDPTLLFINAGMNQFKGYFTGQEKPPYKRAVSSQKCVRAGGKHNDLENVGRTGRHHTFFEMLGNFSFGDYFKKEAIQRAWEFVTEELKLPRDRLYASVFRDDKEGFGIWSRDMGLDPSRIHRFGEKDNFWAMGETGPCGPCSEIFFDRGPEAGCGKPTCDVGCDCDRYMEFWNLVFMEFEQKPDGSRVKLPKPSIDTGMGLERVTAIVAGVPTNYDTDLFVPLLADAERLTGKSYARASEEERVSMRVIADHIRAMTFLLADGVLPSNEGRGYVLRRIMRRGMRHGWKLGLKRPFLHEMSGTVAERMGDPYTELRKQASASAASIRREEEKFAETIERGLDLLEGEIAKVGKGEGFDGRVAFRLYDTYGFPKDLTEDILRERGLVLDDAGFEEAFTLHREKARGSWKGSAARVIDGLAAGWVSEGRKSEFLGYDELTAEGTIGLLVRDGAVVASANEGECVELLADRTPFYGESGGQVGDIGTVAGEGFSLEVVDTKKPTPEILLHECRVTEGEVRAGSRAVFSVDAAARGATARNHTATHLLHATLKEVLGPHVSQKGSLVAPERLRFDFTHPSALTVAELASIETRINERIWRDSPVTKEVLPLEKALASGAVALFDEKYGAQARVVTVADYSKELCGGTHLSRTGEIGLFKIVKESSVAAGIRRIEAFTGHRALRHVAELEHRMKELSALLGSPAEELGERVAALLKSAKELRKRGTAAASEGEARVRDVNGIALLTSEIPDADARSLRESADRALEKIGTGVVVLGSRREGKASVVVKVSKELSGRVDANRLARVAAEVLKGSGGGRSDMAQAGGPEAGRVGEAMEKIAEELSQISGS